MLWEGDTSFYFTLAFILPNRAITLIIPPCGSKNTFGWIGWDTHIQCFRRYLEDSDGTLGQAHVPKLPQRIVHWKLSFTK